MNQVIFSDLKLVSYKKKHVAIIDTLLLDVHLFLSYPL